MGARDAETGVREVGAREIEAKEMEIQYNWYGYGYETWTREVEQGR